ncbi:MULTISPECIES: PilZ domain-containing protein [unclassified Sphingomonas]|jgi:hypothetical protein|uniref:PilZ domain-containing protein n=1 Tax=unclassified Sphingomonas TaxID=196159 RepID=UPI00082B3822|nr:MULTISPECIES: PilZ domain-containing protein [unclassified Sphingomonas]MCH4893000.1 PilZ domain-containing protein [Sphingomonas sp. SFZ2018-12]
MAMRATNLAIVDQRAVERDEVHYRARAFGPDARPINLLVVNISPHGLMARCEDEYAPGTRIRINMPVIGVTVAEVRWWLGGRMGCQFEQPIDRASYYELLAGLLRR